MAAANQLPIVMRVSFTGLCLFVPDDTNRKMHVILPRSPGFGQRHHHVARLLVDTAHLRPNSTVSDGTFAHFPLEHWGLELPAPGSSGTAATDLSGFPRIARLEGLITERVKRDRLDRIPPPGKVAARVTLAAGQTVDASESVLWEVREADGGTRRTCMTFRVHWIIPDLAGASFTGRLLSLVQSPLEKDLPPLYPISDDLGRPVIDLKVYHIPKDELPPVPDKQCTPPDPTNPVTADHFHLFSNVFDTSTVPTPTLADCECTDEPEPEPEAAEPGAEKPARADEPEGAVRPRLVQPLASEIGSFFTCIVATAPLT